MYSDEEVALLTIRIHLMSSQMQQRPLFEKYRLPKTRLVTVPEPFVLLVFPTAKRNGL